MQGALSNEHIVGPELHAFANVVGYKLDGSWEGVFWKIFYQEYKHHVWHHAGRFYRLSAVPCEVVEITNTKGLEVFGDLWELENRRYDAHFFWVAVVLWLYAMQVVDSGGALSLAPIFLAVVWLLRDKIVRAVYRARLHVLRR
jgi:hypothetical protein